MNIRLTLLFPAILAAALVTPAVVLAQQAPSSPNAGWQSGTHHRHSRSPYMQAMRGLNLSAQQKTQMKQLVLQFRQTHPAGSPADPQARKQLRANIVNLLTPAQRQRFRQNLKTIRQHRSGHQTGTTTR